MVTAKRQVQLHRPNQRPVDWGNRDLLPDSQKVPRDGISENSREAHVAAGFMVLSNNTSRRPFVPSGIGTISKVYSRTQQNTKGKNDNKEDQNVRRRALADISNARGSSSSGPVTGPKPLASKGSNSRIVLPKARKSSLVKPRDNATQRVGDRNSLTSSVTELGTSSNDASKEARIANQPSVSNSTRCLPLLMTAEQRKDAKDNHKGSVKTQSVGIFAVKTRLSRKVVPQVSMGRSHLQRNGAREGPTSLEETNRNDRIAFRKSAGPLVKPAIKGSNTHRVSGSNGAPTAKKSSSIAAISSSGNNEAEASSVRENIPKMVSFEVSLPETSSDAKNSIVVDGNATSNKKSRRRRSYTSLLMTRSKLLEENEGLPSIDDACNELEVAEYVDDIYQYYWFLEGHNISLADYMSTQTVITPQMRGILINWLIEAHGKFRLMQETLYLMATLLDQYLSQVQIQKCELQLVGLTALLLASKYEDFWHPRIKDLVSISGEAYTHGQMLEMEKQVLRKLKFRLNVPTAYVFMLRFLKAAQSESKLQNLAHYLIELCLVEYEALKFKPSMVSASAIFVARCTLKMDPAWTPLLAKHARYGVPQLRECAEMILRFQKMARTARLQVTYDKFMSPDLGSVAAIKPLNELPL
ncbi:unnamed protein product [Linum trigynum]|uniref:B-like cyclin n=1 Tax=Linum trigynum TaxID=586398 RepID=A0AAV2CPI7_9ROSI